LVIEKLVRNRALYILSKKKYCVYNYIQFIFEFVYKDNILMWEALIWKRVAVDKKTIIPLLPPPVQLVHERPLLPLIKHPL
jgi:hypothetical protein